MTDTDKHAFVQAMATLCLAFRENEPDAPMLRVYFLGLKDLDVELVTGSVPTLVAGQKFFPKPAEWRAAAVQLERQNSEALTARIRELHKRGIELCAACADTGWDRTDDDRVMLCECRGLRRLEVLGRRPMPLLPPDPKQLPSVEAQVDEVIKTLAERHAWPK